MGTDFLEKTAPTFQKSWDQGRVNLVSEDLLTRLPTVKARSFAAELSTSGSLKKGDKITVDKIGKALVATRGQTELARCEDSPAELLDALSANSGVAEGTVQEVHDLAGIAEISICIGNPK
jgi:hypothetical protein